MGSFPFSFPAILANKYCCCCYGPTAINWNCISLHNYTHREQSCLWVRLTAGWSGLGRVMGQLFGRLVWVGSIEIVPLVYVFTTSAEFRFSWRKAWGSAIRGEDHCGRL